MRAPFRSDSLLAVIAGPVVWTVHFLACYLTVSLACAAGSAGLVPPTIATVTAASLLLLAGIGLAAWRRWRSGRGREHTRGHDAAVAPFLALVTLMLSVLSAIAVLWVALPGAMLPSCAA